MSSNENPYDEHHDEPVLSSGATGQAVTTLEEIAEAYVLAYRTQHHLVMSIGAALLVREVGNAAWLDAVVAACAPHGIDVSELVDVQPIVDIGGGLLMMMVDGRPTVVQASADAFSDPLAVQASMPPAENPFTA